MHTDDNYLLGNTTHGDPPLDANEPLLPPVGVPGVLDQPVVLPVLCPIANHHHCMIQPLFLGTSSKYTFTEVKGKSSISKKGPLLHSPPPKSWQKIYTVCSVVLPALGERKKWTSISYHTSTILTEWTSRNNRGDHCSVLGNQFLHQLFISSTGPVIFVGVSINFHTYNQLTYFLVTIATSPPARTQ